MNLLHRDTKKAKLDSAFFLTIHEDGTVDSDDLENIVVVSINGTFEDYELEGDGELSADSNGVCVARIVSIHIREHWVFMEKDLGDIV